MSLEKLIFADHKNLIGTFTQATVIWRVDWSLFGELCIELTHVSLIALQENEQTIHLKSIF